MANRGMKKTTCVIAVAAVFSLGPAAPADAAVVVPAEAEDALLVPDTMPDAIDCWTNVPSDFAAVCSLASLTALTTTASADNPYVGWETTKYNSNGTTEKTCGYYYGDRFPSCTLNFGGTQRLYEQWHYYCSCDGAEPQFRTNGDIHNDALPDNQQNPASRYGSAWHEYHTYKNNAPAGVGHAACHYESQDWPHAPGVNGGINPNTSPGAPCQVTLTEVHGVWGIGVMYKSTRGSPTSGTTHVMIRANGSRETV